LGLNIAKELVQLNLGQIHVESEVGKGSTFSFSLPVNDPSVVFDRFVRRRAAQTSKSPTISLISAAFEAKFNGEGVPVIDEFLQRSVRANDLVFRASERSWLIAASCSDSEAPKMIARLNASWEEYCRNYTSSSLPPIELRFLESHSCGEQLEALRAAWRRLVASPETTSTAGKTVLVVDDDAEVNSCLSVRLEAAGYHVLSAYDGDQGLSTALARHPDAVLLDVRMPKKDGLTMLREMRTYDEVRDTPVVVLSASVRDQHRALEAGANYFLTKPYESKDVLSALETSLTQGSLP
jgi:CheY-like chemotaxis protein